MGKHLTLDERINIASLLNKQESFKSIGTFLGKDCTTVSKEVRNHRIFKQTGAPGRSFNACRLRYVCDKRHLCKVCIRSGSRVYCWSCQLCNKHCPDFIEERCPSLDRAPYVCNGCTKLKTCSLTKCFYQPGYAHKEYLETLSQTRQGLSLSEQEIKHLDSIISPLIRKGQSIHHICATNKDSIMVSESTIYRLIGYNVFTARNIDLPRKVRYSSRKVRKHVKVDTACRIGRSYQDYLSYMDMDITKSDEDGIIFVTSAAEKNHLRIDTVTTLIVYALRSYYEDAISKAPEETEVLMTYGALNSLLQETGLSNLTKRLSSSTIASSLRTLDSYNVVSRANGTYGDPSYSFFILPTIKFVISAEKMNALYGFLTKPEHEEEAPPRKRRRRKKRCRGREWTSPSGRICK